MTPSSTIEPDDPYHRRKVEIIAYDPAWPGIFVDQQAKIRAALGEAAVLIEHVGSTSVPGLAAKPVIDIHLTVMDAADEAGYAPGLERAGYRLIIREPGWFEHRMFGGSDPAVNLHVFSTGCSELDRCRLFRDWLRADPQDVALYVETKRGLAARPWDRVQDYADAKHDVIAQIMARAEAWQGGKRLWFGEHPYQSDDFT